MLVFVALIENYTWKSFLNARFLVVVNKSYKLHSKYNWQKKTEEKEQKADKTLPRFTPSTRVYEETF